MTTRRRLPAVSHVRRAAGWTPLVAVAMAVAVKRPTTVAAAPAEAQTRAQTPTWTPVPPRKRSVVRGVGRVITASGRAIAMLAAVLGVLLLLVIGVGPITGRYRVVTVLSGSMQRSMPVGSMIIDTPMPRTAVRPGQVITYQAPIADHRVVTHRVVRVIADGDHPVVITKGDSNNGVDPWEAALTNGPAWHMRAAVPYAGYAVMMLGSPNIRHVTAGVVPVLLAMSWLAAIWRKPDPQVELAPC